MVPFQQGPAHLRRGPEAKPPDRAEVPRIQGSSQRERHYQAVRPGQGLNPPEQQVTARRQVSDRRPAAAASSFCFRYGPGAPGCSNCPSPRTPVTETSCVRIAEPGGIKQVEIAFDRIPQFVLRVAAVATVLAPPAMIPVLVADLAQISQRRAQVFPELSPPICRLGISRFSDPKSLASSAVSARSSGPSSTDQMRTGPRM